MSKRRTKEEILYRREFDNKTVELTKIGARYHLAIFGDNFLIEDSIIDPTESTPPIIPARP